MKLLLTLSFVSILALNSNAQAIEKKIDFLDKSQGSDIVATSDGGFVIVGDDFDTESGKKGALIFKLDSNGEILWKSMVHQVGGTTTYFSKVVETIDGEIIAMGTSIKYNAPDPGNVQSTIVVKLSATGILLWTKSYANPGDMLWNTAPGNNIQPYSDGGAIVSMNISSLHCGGAAVMRLGNDGSLIWSKNYYSAGNANDILVLPTGEIYFTGSLFADGMYIAHLTQVEPANGNQIVSRIYNFLDGDTYGQELIYDGTNIYLAGNHDGHMFLIKLKNDGTYDANWSVFVGSSMDIPLAAEIISDQIVLAGIKFDMGQASIIAQIDFDGNLLDDYTFTNMGGALSIYSMDEYGEDQITVVGTFEEFGSGGLSVYFGKSDFPLESFCSFSGEVVTLEDASVIVSIPIFDESISPVELPISLEIIQLNHQLFEDYCSLTEVVENEDQNTSLKIYPNPAADIIQIESISEISKITIYDALGKLVLSQETQSNETLIQLNLSGFSKGLYIIEITTENGNLNQRFIKE